MQEPPSDTIYVTMEIHYKKIYLTRKITAHRHITHMHTQR